jgi:A/G-specific adenine glycosylase
MTAGFATKLIAWQKRHGRHDLPWQNTRDPYAIWVSEIMLQQTQVAAVIPYYRRFLQSFPDISTLAAATQDAVLALWSGLGYYSRCRNLHEAAGVIEREHAGRFPADFERILQLPGIGRSTAAAICVFAFGERNAILDGNVKRVLARYYGIEGYPGEKRVENDLWRRADALLPQNNIGAYTQGLMDLGASVCARRRPRCDDCPLREDCVAHRKGLTGRLPAPKPKKTLPRRTTVMLVLQHAGEVLLEKRPATGIWGGLWCFPEVAANDDIGEICSRHFGAQVKILKPLPVLEHGFTHFHLSITPQRLRVTSLSPRTAEPGHIWLSVDEARTAAIPTPVKRILAGL